MFERIENANQYVRNQIFHLTTNKRTFTVYFVFYDFNIQYDLYKKKVFMFF